MKDVIGRALARMRVEAVLPHIRGRVLDLGCGSNELVRRYHLGIGVDVHPWAGVNLIIEDSSKLPFDAQSFDAIALIASLNHIPNREAALDECRRVLRANGCIVVTMLRPLTSRIWHWLRAPWDSDQRERGIKDGEVGGFTPRQLRQMFDRHGLELVSQHAFMLRLNRVYVFRIKESAIERISVFGSRPTDLSVSQSADSSQ
jgi:SAM-dependent methyltransferase